MGKVKLEKNTNIIKLGAFSGPLFMALDTAGMDWRKIANRLPLRNFDYEDPEKFVPIALMYEFLHEVEKILGHEGLMSLLAQGFQLPDAGDLGVVEELGDYGSFMLGSPNLYHFLLTNTVNKDAMITFNEVYLVVKGEEARWTYVFTDPPAPGRIFVHAIMIAYMLATMRIFAGKDWLPSALEMKGTAPHPFGPILPQGKYPITYGHDQFAMVFPTHMLALNNPYRERFRDSNGLSILSGSLTEKIAIILNSYEPGQMSALVDFSDYFNMSERSLRRKLLEEGTNFSEIRKEQTFIKSADMLSNTEQTINEIASQVGYNESANFIRFFKSYIGVSPSRYRELV